MFGKNAKTTQQLLLLPAYDLYLVEINSMLAVKGIYDGRAIQLLEKIKNRKRYKVIVNL